MAILEEACGCVLKAPPPGCGYDNDHGGWTFCDAHEEYCRFLAALRKDDLIFRHMDTVELNERCHWDWGIALKVRDA
jgi:hypothetical protein